MPVPSLFSSLTSGTDSRDLTKWKRQQRSTSWPGLSACQHITPSANSQLQIPKRFSVWMPFKIYLCAVIFRSAMVLLLAVLKIQFHETNDREFSTASLAHPTSPHFGLDLGEQSISFWSSLLTYRGFLGVGCRLTKNKILVTLSKVWDT